MKRFFKLIFFLLYWVSFGACVSLSKRATDNSVINYVRHHPEIVREAATFAISTTITGSSKVFKSADIPDAIMRKKVESLGNNVSVFYKKGDYSNIPDSNVTFKSITLFGVTEIIYDFAATERNFSNDTINPKSYYFVKIAERVYYRRREVPLM